MRNFIILVITVFVFGNDAFAQSIDTNAWYRLKNMFRGDGECLEGNQASSDYNGGVAFMDKCQNVSGQLWRFEDAGNGYYRLKNQFRGDGECLEGNQISSSDKGGRAFMDKCQNVSGQLWKIEDAGNGYYRLKNQFRGDGECLEGNQAANFSHGKYNGGAHMDRQQNVSGQMWKFEKAGTISGATKNTLNADQSLQPIGESFSSSDILISANKQYMLRLQQEDGNLCIYRYDNGKQGGFVWCSMAHGFAPGKFIMQTDGNAVVYTTGNEAKWSSETHPYFDAKFKDANNKPVKLVLEDDGALKLYTKAGAVMWSSK